MDQSEVEYMTRAIEEARQSEAEDDRAHPKVGVVVVKDDKVLATAHRGQKPGNHAEYFALEEILSNESLAGATIYTTLEPCTTRNHPKVPCADRLVERKVRRVVIGMLDPNPDISGRGQRRLREANIATELFPAELMQQVEELNREFSRSFRPGSATRLVDQSFITSHAHRPLDEWYRRVNGIYWNRNFYRDSMSIFTHLVEVVGGLSLLASNKNKAGMIPGSYVPKAVAWWLALCGKVGVKSVSDMLWAKFPHRCAYCHRMPHDPDECSERKAAHPGPIWETLAQLGAAHSNQRPSSLSDWQRMFSSIYPAQQTEDFGPTFGRLTEELGELAEALRVFPAAPGYFLSEAADVFAWLMHVQNILDQKAGTLKADRGRALREGFCRSYPDHCLDCGSSPCKCPPILETTIGRIAHEVRRNGGSFDLDASFLTPDKARLLFQQFA